MTGLMLTDDLIFFSRVSGAARAKGLVVKQCGTLPRCWNWRRANRPAA